MMTHTVSTIVAAPPVPHSPTPALPVLESPTPALPVLQSPTPALPVPGSQELAQNSSNNGWFTLQELLNPSTEQVGNMDDFDPDSAKAPVEEDQLSDHLVPAANEFCALPGFR